MSRRRALVLAGLVAALATLVLWRLASAPAVRNLSPRPGPIVVLGDSLAAGVGSKGQKGGFVAILSQRLGVEIVNRGVSGDSTADGLKRLDADVLALKPALVILELGGNDFLRRMDPDRTFANLEALIRRSQDSGAAVLVLGVRGGLLRNRGQNRFREVAERNQAAYVPDLLEGIFAHPALMADAIHPNDAGHQQIARRLDPILRRLLKRMGRATGPT